VRLILLSIGLGLECKKLVSQISDSISLPAHIDKTLRLHSLSHAYSLTFYSLFYFYVNAPKINWRTTLSLSMFYFKLCHDKFTAFSE